MRDSFIIYRSFYEAIIELDEKDQLSALKMICEYALNDVEQNDVKGMLGVVWKLTKPQLDSNSRKHAVGALGGRPKVEEKTNGYQNKKPMVSKPKNHRLSKSKTNGYESAKPNVNDNVNENDNDNENAASIQSSSSSSSLSQFSTQTRNIVQSFENLAYPPDQPNLYTDVIEDSHRVEWCKQWEEIQNNPVILKYLNDRKQRFWSPIPGGPPDNVYPALWVYIEWAYKAKREKYQKYFKDFSYLLQPHRNRTNIESMAEAYQDWRNELMKNAPPRIGN